MAKSYMNQVVKAGDCIVYTSNLKQFVLPAGNGVKKEHVFRPADVKRWRVLKNKQGIVELIPAESVGRVTLYGRVGWRNAIQHLETICKAYADGKYALDARTLGMTFNDPSISVEEIMEACKTDYMACFTDHGYASDLQHMQDGAYPAKISWFASRSVKKLEDGYALNLRLSFGKAMGEITLAELAPDGVCRKEYERTFEICPVRLMAANVVVCDGDGSAENPYRLELGAY